MFGSPPCLLSAQTGLTKCCTHQLQKLLFLAWAIHSQLICHHPLEFCIRERRGDRSHGHYLWLRQPFSTGSEGWILTVTFLVCPVP